MLVSWSRSRSRQLQKCTFSLPKWVQNTHWAPHSPPECRISSKCQWFRYNIKCLAFRWGIGGFELGGKLIGTVCGGGCTGTTVNTHRKKWELQTSHPPPNKKAGTCWLLAFRVQLSPFTYAVHRFYYSKRSFQTILQQQQQQCFKFQTITRAASASNITCNGSSRFTLCCSISCFKLDPLFALTCFVCRRSWQMCRPNWITAPRPLR